MVGKEWLYVSARPYQCDGVGNKGPFPSMNFPDFAGNSRKYKSAVELRVVYFGIWLILGEILPGIYREQREANGLDPSVFGVDLLKRFNGELSVLKEQYQKKSTKNFEIENGKLRR